MPVLLSEFQYYKVGVVLSFANANKSLKLETTPVHHLGLSEAGNSLLSSNSQVNKSDSSLLTKDQEIQAGIPALI